MTALIQYTAADGDVRSAVIADMSIDERQQIILRTTGGEQLALQALQRPVVLDGADALTEMFYAIERQIAPHTATDPVVLQSMDQQMLPLKIALKMHEIIEMSITQPAQIASKTHTPLVFQVQFDGRARIGWHFEKNELAALGNRVHYDRGLAVSHEKNHDAQVVAAPPMVPAQLQAFLQLSANEPHHVVLLLQDGQLRGGRAQYRAFDNSFYIDGQSYSADEVACATRLPDEQCPVWQRTVDVGNPAHNQEVFAWDNERVRKNHTGSYVDFGTFDATGNSNKRFQGATGPFFDGFPWSSKQSWASMEGIAAQTMLREFHSLQQHLVRKHAVKIDVPGPEASPSTNRPRRA